MTFWNDGTFTRNSSVQGLPDILKWHNLRSLNKTLDLLIEFKFCEGNFYFLNGSKNCMVATYNFGSVYIETWNNLCIVDNGTVSLNELMKVGGVWVEAGLSFICQHSDWLLWERRNEAALPLTAIWLLY